MRRRMKKHEDKRLFVAVVTLSLCSGSRRSCSACGARILTASRFADCAGCRNSDLALDIQRRTIWRLKSSFSRRTPDEKDRMRSRAIDFGFGR